MTTLPQQKAKNHDAGKKLGEATHLRSQLSSTFSILDRITSIHSSNPLPSLGSVLLRGDDHSRSSVENILSRLAEPSSFGQDWEVVGATSASPYLAQSGFAVMQGSDESDHPPIPEPSDLIWTEWTYLTTPTFGLVDSVQWEPSSFAEFLKEADHAVDKNLRQIDNLQATSKRKWHEPTEHWHAESPALDGEGQSYKRTIVSWSGETELPAFFTQSSWPATEP